MISESRLIEEFKELVQIDSETKQERAIADHLTEKLIALGFTVIEDESAAKTGHAAGNLIATLPANTDKAIPKLFFTSHMDTVKPGIGIVPVIDEAGYITSSTDTILGADDKAGIAALFEMIRVLKEQQIEHGQIQLIITAGEESGLMGARSMDSSLVDADFGYALDSNGTVGTIAVAAPTQARIVMEIFGKSAHAGVNPEDGISAIQVAGKAISRMKLGRIDHETTANIGKFEGGEATNVICDYARLEAEARSLVHEKVEVQLAAMKQSLESTCADFGATGKFQSVIVYPGFKFTEDDAVVQLAQRAASKLGVPNDIFHTGGGSDANIFNSFGIPTANLAVGYEFIHTTDERIHKDELIRAAHLVTEIVRETAQLTEWK
ncbi:tripeptide aminopeptidase [Paenibacillus sp. SORGH_AS306]|uniref:M20/M25/M40 family metallo-hydrolase n=1 Tax=unclassified Paenibacillus TaxID=185978 RepID=UPI002788E614|nr:MULTISPECIES: M20/M25/M40 family metallo-hydrolase [unclassified Paenibacillus]MDQ1234797.1 tripeptide aminopeptidase [Paenibacillus sp. SORGH_AS_0306]MDR6111844.1 tripeptide aminopeptidase [Paenibacillus sp. SORGH_AS_0338]